MEKAEMQVKAKKAIDGVYDSIARLEDKAAKANESVRNEMEKEVQVLKLMRDDIKVKYQKIQNATTDSVGDIQKAFEDTTEVFKKAASKLEDRFLQN